MPVTQADVAVEAKVSRALVSLVMRGSPQVSEAKRTAVLRAAAELGYRRNTHAAQLASRRSKILGVVLTELANPIFSQVLGALENEAESRGYGLLPTLGDLDVDQERASVNRLLGHRLDGVVLVGTGLPPAEILDLAHQMPVVTVGRAIAGVDSVEVDGRAGASLAVGHLIDHGHRAIAYIDGGDAAGAEDRRTGYLETMQAAGLGDRVQLESDGNSESGGIVATERILRQSDPPTAIFTFNDLGATGAIAAAREHAVSVPDQLSIIGFDDSPFSSLRCIGLTTVAQPTSTIATTALRLLLSRVDGATDPTTPTLIAPRLVIRSTTGAAVGGG